MKSNRTPDAGQDRLISYAAPDGAFLYVTPARLATARP
jgi:hypothetical protein